MGLFPGFLGNASVDEAALAVVVKGAEVCQEAYEEKGRSLNTRVDVRTWACVCVCCPFLLNACLGVSFRGDSPPERGAASPLAAPQCSSRPCMRGKSKTSPQYMARSAHAPDRRQFGFSGGGIEGWEEVLALR